MYQKMKEELMQQQCRNMTQTNTSLLMCRSCLNPEPSNCLVNANRNTIYYVDLKSCVFPNNFFSFNLDAHVNQSVKTEKLTLLLVL